MCLACPEGLEPPTYSLEGYCSIQLSYGQMGFRLWCLLAERKGTSAAALGAVRGSYPACGADPPAVRDFAVAWVLRL